MRHEVIASNPLLTRADVQQFARDLIEPLVPHFSPGRAQVRLGENRGLFGDPAGWLEGFCRPLWGAAPLEAGSGDFTHWSLWRQGLASGVDPANQEYWGLSGDTDQRSVEQAALGFALLLSPRQIWEPLSPKTKEQVIAWLGHINDVKLVKNNWLFFRVLVNLGLRNCGQKWPHDQVESDLAQIEKFDVGGGWYSDGEDGPPWRNGRVGDYYGPWALHFYSLIYSRFAAQDDPARTARFKDRSARFALDFQHFFDAHGAALPFGRSLTYRFAQCAFWGALAFAGVEALPWAVTKGIYLRHLRWWIQQPVFSETGLLTIGYGYPNLLMAEAYNSSQSPYWAMKAFLPLALPPDHPFWVAEEAPLPLRPAVHTVPGAKLILTTDPATHDVTAINPGQPVLGWPRNGAHKYSKCAYSTRFGFSVQAGAATAEEGGGDNVLSLSDDGRLYRVREQCLEPAVADGVAYSRWQPWPDVEVTTWLIAEPDGHVRIHSVRSSRKLWSLEAGFAVGWTSRQDLQTEPSPGVVSTSRGASTLRDLLGARQSGIVEAGANSNLLVSLSSMPVLQGTHDPGQAWLACWVCGSGDKQDTFPNAADFKVRAGGTGCQVLRRGQLWWSNEGNPCGTSSQDRLKSLKMPA